MERLRPIEIEDMLASLESRHSEDDQPVSMEDAIADAPVFDEGSLPDPMSTPPPGLGRLGS